MVTLGLALVIIGGKSDNDYNKEIYNFECAREICKIIRYASELSISRGWFVAVPLPDIFSGCITEGKDITIYVIQ